jgi:hypothetical protein
MLKEVYDMPKLIGFAIALIGSLLIPAVIALDQTKLVIAASDDSPSYTAAGELKMPRQYREWIFLSSGLDMNYNSVAAAPGHHTFENVFVNPDSYRSFLRSGKWPDKTIFILELRAAASAASINKNGQTQAEQVVAHEVHVKDARLDGGWAFFEGNDSGIGKPIKRPADCYQCHESHAAVDTTFVQFYPTLLPVARDKGTLSAAYLKEEATTHAAK